MKRKRNTAPSLKLPSFSVDEKIHKRLDEVPLLRHLNKSFACGVLGRAGSGKTSVVIGLLNTPKMMKKLFDKIFVFIPPNSRKSINDDIFGQLPEDQVYSELTVETLIDCFEKVEEEAKEKRRSLVIFDDVQQFLKGECQDLVTHMVNNRRHNRLSLFVVAQSYKKIPKMVRDAFSDLFLFKLSKEDYDEVYREVIHLPPQKWTEIMFEFQKESKENPHSFLFVNTTTNSVFINWDEFGDESDESGKSADSQESTEDSSQSAKRPRNNLQKHS
jgi:hypothetical protein